MNMSRPRVIKKRRRPRKDAATARGGNPGDRELRRRSGLPGHMGNNELSGAPNPQAACSFLVARQFVIGAPIPRKHRNTGLWVRRPEQAFRVLLGTCGTNHFERSIFNAGPKAGTIIPASLRGRL
jgi:hypothetical protein